MTDEELDALEPFMNLSDDEIADIFLMLMLEETAKKRLAKFRAKARGQGTESSANPSLRKTLRPTA